MEKEEVKLSIFAHDMILFVENLKESIKKNPLLPEPINDICKVIGFNIKHKTDLYSLQYVLMQFLNSSMNQSASAADANAMAVAASSGSLTAMVTPIALRSSITIIATVPILVVYPFVQKHFVVGMTIGGVKE